MSIQQVEIVKPAQSWPEVLGDLIGGLFGLAMRVLFVWWAIAVWFPELGLTYWQIVLPVYALRELVLPGPQFKQLQK